MRTTSVCLPGETGTVIDCLALIAPIMTPSSSTLYDRRMSVLPGIRLTVIRGWSFIHNVTRGHRGKVSHGGVPGNSRSAGN